MKTKKILNSFILAAMTASLFTSCEPEEVEQSNVDLSTGVFVLNAGKFQNNNASLSYYDFTTGFTATNIVYDPANGETTFNIDVTKFKNPFDTQPFC